MKKIILLLIILNISISIITCEYPNRNKLSDEETITDTSGNTITKTITFINLEPHDITVQVIFSTQSIDDRSIFIATKGSQTISISFKSGGENQNYVNMKYTSYQTSDSSNTSQEFTQVLNVFGPAHFDIYCRN